MPAYAYRNLYCIARPNPGSYPCSHPHSTLLPPQPATMSQKEAALVSDFLRGLYASHEIEPFYCFQCRKSETMEKPFSECSGCNVVIYCSRECQKSHWKIHKSTCLDNQKLGKKEENKLVRIMIKFRLFYAPLLDCIVLFRYALYNIATKGRGRPKNHIVEIRLSSLPDSMRRSRL